jgi:mono/diheme cytochrome c family protein
MRITVKTVGLGLLIAAVILVAVALTAVGWEVVLGPKARPVSSTPFEVTDARLARGKYLVEGPMHCFLCHSEHDVTTPEYPVIQSKKGAGWRMPIAELNYISARNITPDVETGIGSWSDDEIARAIREGVRKDGTALFPLMPYLDFATLDDEDVKAIVVYLRTIPPVRNVVAKRQLPGPLEYLVNTMPQPITAPQPSHPSGTPAERGKYLVTLAGCGACHTASVDGEPLPGLAFGGGEHFSDLATSTDLVSMNITPDPSGIAHYDEAFLKQTLRTGRVGGRILNHVMPFEWFRNMTDEDIGDIWAYLQTITPVKHRVSNTDPPTPCPVCNRSHGLGDLNVKP